VSSYLLPEGEEDLFYEKMLTYSIGLNSKSRPEFAWKTFLRLRASLKHKPGRFHAMIKSLETNVFVPFLARIYGYLVKNSDYNEFLWGHLGEYYLSKGEYKQAYQFFQLEFKKRKFNRRFLVSFALILMERQEFARSQIYLNLAKKLNTEPEILRKIEEYQRLLNDHVYEVGPSQIRKEADLLFQFGEKEQGLKRLEELLLLSVNSPETYYQMGEMLLAYPAEWEVWEEGKNYLLRYLKLGKPPLERLISMCGLFLEKELHNEMVFILKSIKKNYEKEYRNASVIQELKQKVYNVLVKQIKLFEMYASHKELAKYLEFLLEFSPELYEPHIQLAETLDYFAVHEIEERTALSPELMDRILKLVQGMKDYTYKTYPDRKEQYYLAAVLLSRFPRDKRQYSTEIANLKEALSIDPLYLRARLKLAEVYSDFDFMRRSLTELETLNRQIPHDEKEMREKMSALFVKNHRECARLAYGNANYFLVMDHMLKAIQWNNHKFLDTESTLWLGYSYVYTEKHQELKDMMDKAVSVLPEHVELYYLQALGYEGLRQYRSAIKIYSKILELGSDSDVFIQECAKNKANLELIVQYEQEQKEEEE
jgi:predicted Zn-dependent protease